MGAKKLKPCKKSKRISSDIVQWDQLIQTVKQIKTEADEKLQEISNICANRECK